jgi:hypothetical protein
MNTPLDVKNGEHALDFSLHLSRLFLGLGAFELSLYGPAYLVIARVSVHVSRDLRNIRCRFFFGSIAKQRDRQDRQDRQDTRLQIRGLKDQHVYPAA